MNAYANQYQRNQVLNASPEQILVMLYDGAIRFSRQAMQALDVGDHKTQAEKISRTMAIVSEFSNTLDFEVGGQIATDLDALYSYMIRELTKANVKNDRQALETVEDLLAGLRETWVEAIEVNRQATSQSSVTDAPEQGVAVSM
jgi:flagellar protein FliS